MCLFMYYLQHSNLIINIDPPLNSEHIPLLLYSSAINFIGLVIDCLTLFVPLKLSDFNVEMSENSSFFYDIGYLLTGIKSLSYYIHNYLMLATSF